ncbi:amidohydrolase [Rhodococcus sp. ABRD24]|uniref:amidohydrolase n=1 Tax=Rhodococcus sp. ABRD24 TaxID=2507582 RepID=UPI00103BE86E|nr:amidohydrolase [Rhodococcus sp. ABRD24]QBJ95892.1 amidohydrolase [Rhodococcus sp. ABRD24]
MSISRMLDSLPGTMPTLEDIYRDLHAHPEFAYSEHRTAGIVAESLRKAGYEVTEGIGVTGVVGVLRNGDGPTVMLRADMDALPVEEKTGLDYASTATMIDETGQAVPLMHACGHDVHVTCLLGAAQQLATSTDLWSGTLVALFQPAEEGRGGALRMIEDDVFGIVGNPDVVLGQHVLPYAAGTVGYRAGAMLAAADSFEARVFGRGAHGSRPETGIDPIVMAASIVMKLQTIVSREVAANEQVVLTVGALHAGTKANIIPDHADLKLSIRTYDRGVTERVEAAVRRVIEAECISAGSPRPPEITELSRFDATVNDPRATDRVVQALKSELGDDQVVEIDPIMISEDVGEFGKAAGAPSVYWALGCVDPKTYAEALAEGKIEEQIPSNHSPLFAPAVQPTLTTGVTALVTAAAAWLSAD